MRFFTAASVAFTALTGFVAAQATTGTAAAGPVETGTMGANAITHPIATDSITAGSTFDITWTNTVGSSVTLVLVDGPTNQLKPVATIVASVDNSGSYTWSVPDNLPASDTYAIRIQYDNNPNNWNYSDRFVFASDVTATPSVTSASSTTTEESSTSTEESSTESSTSTESETSTITSAATTTSTMATRTTTRRSTTTEETEETETSGAPVNAAGSNVSSPVAIIMAVLAAAIFIH